MAETIPLTVHVLTNNWGSDYENAVFATRKDALVDFERLVRQNIPRGTSKTKRNKMVKEAIEYNIFDYEGDGDEGIQPHIMLVEKQVLSR